MPQGMGHMVWAESKNDSRKKRGIIVLYKIFNKEVGPERCEDKRKKPEQTVNRFYREYRQEENRKHLVKCGKELKSGQSIGIK